jgi:cytochrome c-type biogenesis protein CcmF
VIPEIGNFAIILALCFALLQSFAVLYGQRAQAFPFFRLSIFAAIGQMGFLAFAMLCLVLCFLTNDMTVVYVQQHSHQLLPFIYRVGAAWGGHEGSLLLWCLILSGWTAAFMLFSGKKLPQHSFVKIIMLLGFISTGFISFLFFTSNPFRRLFPLAPISGDDLTPILQDPGLIFHPPMLYLGYVGFSLAFAFALCALLEKNLAKNWITTLRPWVILPWSFLSVGIVLGSWWAYRELGWGGWWFWDPVENASLLPWLAATGLLHALLVSEKRDTFKGWTILLAIVTFTLSLLGTFLVRSGILVSVHTFANDPSRGIFLLTYLAVIIGGALLLYSVRIRYFYRAPSFQLFSRETFLLLNTVLMLTAVATITLGTLYPIILDALGLEKISVGEPYFNTVFLPIILPVLLLMGVAPHVKWGGHSLTVLWKKLRLNLLLALVIGATAPYILGFPFHAFASVGIFFSVWIVIATLQFIFHLWRSKQKITAQHWSMIIAHIGIAVLAMGVTVTKSYSEERQVKMNTSEIVHLAGYNITLQSLAETKGANFKSTTATFAVQRNHDAPKLISADQRIYTSHDQTLSKPGILFNPLRDIYIALGAELPDGAWAVRIYYKPLVRWIWSGGFMLLAGGLLSLFRPKNKGEAL